MTIADSSVRFQFPVSTVVGGHRLPSKTASGRAEREDDLCAVGQPGVAHACLGEPLQLVAFVCRQT